LASHRAECLIFKAFKSLGIAVCESVVHSGEEHDEVIGKPLENVASATSSNGKGRERERHGSILCIWTQGKDKDGKNVIFSGEEHDGVIEVPVEKVVSLPNKGQERRGSVLSMWTQGKDKDRRPVILSGFEEDD
jgi:hypothetical protein